MYINPITKSNQSNPAPGLLYLTPEQEAMYLEYNGFVTITSTDPVEIEPDNEAWEAWKAWLAEQPEPEEPETIDQRIAALEAKNAALTTSNQFLEDCLVEMAGIVYA